MVYRPIRSLSRCALAACAVSLGAASLGAQTPTPTAPAALRWGRIRHGSTCSLGFSYYGAHGQLKPAGINYSSINEGAIGSGAYYFNHYFGGEFVYTQPSRRQERRVLGREPGPIVRAPMENFTLFAHGLAGGARVGGPEQRRPDRIPRAVHVGTLL